jgi:hypothetical protein
MNFFRLGSIESCPMRRCAALMTSYIKPHRCYRQNLLGTKNYTQVVCARSLAQIWSLACSCNHIRMYHGLLYLYTACSRFSNCASWLYIFSIVQPHKVLYTRRRWKTQKHSGGGLTTSHAGKKCIIYTHIMHICSCAAPSRHALNWHCGRESYICNYNWILNKVCAPSAHKWPDCCARTRHNW